MALRFNNHAASATKEQGGWGMDNIIPPYALIRGSKNSPTKACFSSHCYWQHWQLAIDDASWRHLAWI